MKLLIDIPDDVYENIEHGKGDFINTLNWAVRNGTPVSNEDDLISRSALIKWIDDSVSQYGHTYSTDMLNMWGLFKDYLINNAPTVAESCKELHEFATERPQTIGCFNCKYETKMVCEEPCMVCNTFYSEWRQKE